MKKILSFGIILAMLASLLVALPALAGTASISKSFSPEEGELGDTVHVTIDLDIALNPGDSAQLIDALPEGLAYKSGTFEVNGGPAADPSISDNTLSYPVDVTTLTIEFDVKVVEAHAWCDTEVTNQAVVEITDAAGIIETFASEPAEFTILMFEQLDKYVGLLKADVVFAMDLTGSMWDERDEMEASADYIMNTLQAQINDVAFGLISFADYPATYSTAEPGSVPETYTATYGSSWEGVDDYAYSLDVDITEDKAIVAAAIAALPYLNGNDTPEDYTRIIHEAWNDTNLHWRDGAERFLILFGDDVPHDTNFDCRYNDGILDNTGGDPGRDEVLGTGDDLDFETEVANAAAADVSIMAVFSGASYKRYAWEYMAAQTDGQYFPLANASDIPETVYQIIKAEAKATPLEVGLYEDVDFPMVIEITNPYGWDMTEVKIKDNFGGDLELLTVNGEDVVLEGKKSSDEITVDPGIVYLLATGKTEKVHMSWDIGTIAAGADPARLFLLLSTDLNPGQGKKDPPGKNEYTSTGEHELNSGATVKFVDPDGTQLSAHTGSIMVTVVGEETD